MKKLKQLLIIMVISLTIVICGWLWFKYFSNKNNLIASFGAFLWWVPGFLILGSLVGAWQAIHLTLWLNLIPVISFIFWFIVLLIIDKGITFLKARKKHIISRSP